MVILKHNATKNTAFTKAPNTSALAQPNVFFDHFFGDICNEIKIQNENCARRNGVETIFINWPFIAIDKWKQQMNRFNDIRSKGKHKDVPNSNAFLKYWPLDFHKGVEQLHILYSGSILKRSLMILQKSLGAYLGIVVGSPCIIQ